MEKSFAAAIEQAIAQKMEDNDNIFIMGEDVQLLRSNLFARFGKNRVRNTPISESAFLGAGVGAAMAGLHPIVEIMLVDFIGVCVDGLLNHAAKIPFFSGNRWEVPLVVRTACGGGYGDGGQHEQSLWGWLAHIPGLVIVVPSNPLDAARLMVQALETTQPVIYFEHKLLADYWLDYLGSGDRVDLDFNVPDAGALGEIPEVIEPLEFGKANLVKEGAHVTLVSIGVSVHRCLEAAQELEKKEILAEVIDLRTLVPLDIDLVKKSVEKTGHLIVVDEDYEKFGLSGEIAAELLENKVEFQFARVCTQGSIPFNLKRELETLPNVKRILAAVETLLQDSPLV